MLQSWIIEERARREECSGTINLQYHSTKATIIKIIIFVVEISC